MESWEGKARRDSLNLSCVVIPETCERVLERIEAAISGPCKGREAGVALPEPISSRELVTVG